MMEASQATLFQPAKLRGGIKLSNRVVMAPMTRARASEPGGVPSPFAATYYAQRATAGLIVTEATNISPGGKGYSQTPGIYTDEQQAGWREIADAVHQRGGRIFMQLWHVGRIANHETCGGQPVAPSAQTAPGSVWVARPDGWTGSVPCDPARELSTAEIDGIVADFANAAERAIEAGLDGIELHGANGYLIDQFLRSTTNHRPDGYGADQRARLRFLAEVVAATTDRIGADRVGIRLSPIVGFADARDPEIFQTTLMAAELLEAAGLIYLHLAEGDSSWEGLDGINTEFRQSLRRTFRGSIIVAHQYDLERANRILDDGLADLVAFGRPFIGNPDLVERLKRGLPLVQSEKQVWYGGGAVGYTDFPNFDA